jgi:SAM-dependent methyltransferase
MDCFWLFLPDDYLQQAVLWRDFYRCFGEYYEDLIDDRWNIECIGMLVSHIDARTGFHRAKRILDFGCGSGLSTKVKVQGKILGYEPVDEMRKQAQQRGMELLTREEIQNMPDNTFDAVFSSYVFHMAVLDGDIELVLGRMKQGAIWVANFYKNINLEYVNAVFIRNGCRLKRLRVQEERYGAVYEYQK